VTCDRGWRTRAAPLILVVAALSAYYESFHGVFVFDDLQRITQNAHIRHLWPPWETMADTSRPLVQLTLALDYAMSGLDVWSYHAFNLAVHVLASLSLFGIVHRTLRQTIWPASIRTAAPQLALASALLWTVHPLHTQAVTYIIQRAESLMSLFYLLVVYCVIRAIDSAAPGRWYAAAVSCAALGAASKPVIVTAPLVAMVWDRVFATRSFRDLLARRWPLYAGLRRAGCWSAASSRMVRETGVRVPAFRPNPRRPVSMRSPSSAW
jgi:hypothetical protein